MLSYMKALMENLTPYYAKPVALSEKTRDTLLDYFKANEKILKDIQQHTVNGQLFQANKLCQQYVKNNTDVMTKILHHTLQDAENNPNVFKDFIAIYRKNYEHLRTLYKEKKPFMPFKSAFFWKALSSSIGLMALNPVGTALKANSFNKPFSAKPFNLKKIDINLVKASEIKVNKA